MTNLDLRKSISSLAKLVAVAIGILAAILFAPNANDYFAAYSDKADRLEHTPGARGIVVGGSGMAFGIDTEKLTSALGRPFVNTGLHAGLGLEFMLRHALAEVRKGDLVLVVPEYEILTGAADEGVIASALLSAPPASFRFILADDVAPIVRGFPDFALHKVLVDPAIDLARRYGGRVQYKYHRAGFDQRGDEVGHLAAPNVKADLSMKIDPSVEAGVRLLNSFDEAVRQRGARCVVVYPAISRSASEANRKALDSIARTFTAALHTGALETPNDAVLPDEVFFDTPNHLLNEGRRLNTERILTQLGALEGLRTEAK